MTKQEYIRQNLTQYQCEYVAEYLLDVDNFIIDTFRISVMKYVNTKQEPFYATCNFVFNNTDLFSGEGYSADEAFELCVSAFLHYANNNSFVEKDIIWL